MASAMSDDIANSFTKKQLESLNELFSTFLAPAPLELSPALPALLLDLLLDPPYLQTIPTRSYPPLLSVEMIEEVEYKQICKI